MYVDILKRTPKIYGKRSRDYQILGRVNNAEFNSSKLSIDNMENLRNVNLDDKLTDLAVMTVGFETKHHFSSDALRQLYLTFRIICKHKGTKTAIEEVVKCLLRSQNFDRDFTVTIYRKDLEHPYEVDIVLNYPTDTDGNLTLIDDVLNYILPVGFVYTIYNAGEFRVPVADNLIVKNKVKTTKKSSFDLSHITYEDENIGPQVNFDIIVPRETEVKS